MTKSEGHRLVAMLVAAWPRQPVKAETLEVYAAMLADLDFEAGKAAVMALIQTSRFFPTIAEIRENVAETRSELPDAEPAWGEVQRAIGTVGSYRTPVFECPEIDLAVRDIGWKNICLDENVAATRARFLDAYKARRRRRIQAEATGTYVPPSRQLPSKNAGELPAWSEHGEEVRVRGERIGPAILRLVGGALNGGEKP